MVENNVVDSILGFLGNPLTIWVVFALLLLYLAASSFRIAGENERFAVFMLGRFSGFRGPGLVAKSSVTKLVRLAVGAIGTVSSREFVKFDGEEIPIKNMDSFEVGDAVRIDSFDDTGPVLVRSALRAKTKCPSCGHEF